MINVSKSRYLDIKADISSWIQRNFYPNPDGATTILLLIRGQNNKKE